MTDVTKVVDELGILASWDVAACTFEYCSNLDVPTDSKCKIYNYRAPKELKIEKGDFVVVLSSTGLGVVYVTKVWENNFTNAAKVNKSTSWILAKVDITAHKLRLEVEQKREFTKSQLDERKKVFEDTQNYRLMAENDPESAKLLEELNKIV